MRKTKSGNYSPYPNFFAVVGWLDDYVSCYWLGLAITFF